MEISPIAPHSATDLIVHAHCPARLSSPEKTMLRFFRSAPLLLLLLPACALAARDLTSDYVVVSPKAGWTWQDTTSTLTWGVSYSRYPDYNLGYGIAVNQMFGAPELDVTGKAIILNLGLSAGPMVCRKGVGLTMGAFSSLIYIGEEIRLMWVDSQMHYSFTFFVPLWWRNGKFWDVNGALTNNVNFSMSGYH